MMLAGFGLRSPGRASAAKALSGAVVMVVVGALAQPAMAIDKARRDRAVEMAAKAEAYLKARQHETGGWNVPEVDPTDPSKSRPYLPGVTALVLTGLVMDPSADHDSMAITSAAKNLLNWQQPDGGIYDRVLPSYNTALAVSALAKVRQPWTRDAVDEGVRFLRSLQWSEASDPSIGGDEAPRPVGREHPFYGGVGYGRHGRPDGSNLNIFMQAMEDAGVPADDPAIQRALVFLQRLQMLDSANDMPYADGSRQGGFIYATVPNAESVDGRAGQSFAGTVEETLSDGTVSSRLRAYGSMTYAGFKSYVYAELDRDDERVRAALNWIRDHYTVRENPGVGLNGYYYYLVTFARALGAWGEARVEVREVVGGGGGDAGEGKGEDGGAGARGDGVSEEGARGEGARDRKEEGAGRRAGSGGVTTAERDWANDLVDRLAELQNEDGSFRSLDARWMEDDSVLITAYALIALRTAVGGSGE